MVVNFVLKQAHEKVQSRRQKSIVQYNMCFIWDHKHFDPTNSDSKNKVENKEFYLSKCIIRTLW